MKRFFCVLICITLLAVGTAFAENSIGSMVIVNCEEWVSLRATPSTSANRVAKVPLGAVVDNCIDHDGQWVYAEYDGLCGFILSQYLMPMNGEEEYYDSYADGVSGNVFLHWEKDGYSVVAAREYTNCEILTVQASYNGSALWTWSNRTSVLTELTGTTAFIGGTYEEPQVMVYNRDFGLCALDLYSGENLWILSKNEISLGASNAVAVDANGTMYITGFYGPDPVAISRYGEILWTASVDDMIYWPYQIDLYEDCLVVQYESGNEDGHYVVAFDYADGSVQWSDLSLYVSD